MKTSINLRAYGQKNPLNEYKREAFILFESLLERIRERVTQLICHMQLQIEEKKPVQTQESHPNPTEVIGTNEEKTISRNALCPCGSGKKYKHCCGAINV